MSRWIKFIGIVSLVLVAFGLLGTLTLGGGIFSWSTAHYLLITHYGLGSVGLIVWFALYGVKNSGEATNLMTGRHARFGINALVYLIVFGGLLVAANWYGSRHSKRWDLTEEGVYSLSSQSKKIVQSLNKSVRVVGFKVGDWEKLNDLLDLYKAEGNGKVTTEIIDPKSKPHLVEKYQMKPGNLVYIQYGEGTEKTDSRVNDTSEEAISNAILKLAKGAGKKIYYVEGHGEPALSGKDDRGLDQFISSLKDQQFIVESLLVSTKQAIPDDASAVFLVSPKKPLLDSEKEVLLKYAQTGGRLIMFTDPRVASDVTYIASNFGIEVGDDVVLDQVQQLFSGPALAVQFAIQQYAKHPIVDNLGENSATVMELVRSVRKKSSSDEAEHVTELAMSSSRSFAMKNTALIFDEVEPRAEKGDSDLNGPVSLAAIYENKNTDEKGEKAKEAGEPVVENVSKVVVFGDSDWISNASFNLYSNRELALSVVSWLVGEEGGVSIKPRALKTASTPLPVNVFKTIFVSSFLIPELVLLLGLFIWFSRREVSRA